MQWKPMQLKLTKLHTLADCTPCAVMYIFPPLILKDLNLLILEPFYKVYCKPSMLVTFQRSLNRVM